MPSQFDVDFNAAFTGPALNVFGELTPIRIVPYDPIGRNYGASRAIQAIVLRETRLSTGEMQGQNLWNELTIYVPASDDVLGRVNPQELRKGADMDQYVIDGVTWGCRRVEERNVGGMHKLVLFDGGQTA